MSRFRSFEQAIDDLREELVYLAESKSLKPREAPSDLVTLVRDALYGMAAFTEHPEGGVPLQVGRAFAAVETRVPVANFAELRAMAALAADDDDDRALSILPMALSSDERFRLMWAFVEPAFVYGFVAAYRQLTASKRSRGGVRENGECEVRNFDVQGGCHV